MATLALTITVGGNAVGRTRTISAGHLVRLIAALRVVFPQNPDNRTDEQVVQEWADRTIASLKTITRETEQAAATVAATASIADISFTA